MRTLNKLFLLVVYIMEGKEKQEKIKVRIPETSNRWEPKTVGERLVGKYCKNEPSEFRGKKNRIYTIKTEDHPIRDQDGLVVFYGTTVLNDLLGKIKPGYDVDIVYLGEKSNLDPKKKPMKLFDVEFWVDPTDPILEKIYPDGVPDAIQKKVNGDGPATLAVKDDPEALNMIEHYESVIRDNKGKNHTPTAWEIINCAELEDLPGEDMTRVKVQLADLVKQGKIKEGKQ
jgi:hypothetical protein